MAAVAASVIPALDQRPVKNTICLFDVDGTLTPARRVCIHLEVYPQTERLTRIQMVSPEMLTLLSQLRHKVAIGFVGGSDLVKQQEQLGTASVPVTSLFDFCFAENGLTAYRMGVPLASASFIKWIGEESYQKLVKFILHYIADLEIPKKRGTFIEFRNGMINVSPIGRNASIEERNEYEKYDLEHGIRKKFVSEIQAAFPDLGLT
jgi:phosphomannomutase